VHRDVDAIDPRQIRTIAFVSSLRRSRSVLHAEAQARSDFVEQSVGPDRAICTLCHRTRQYAASRKARAA
jgi:hypothetical protein